MHLKPYVCFFSCSLIYFTNKFLQVAYDNDNIGTNTDTATSSLLLTTTTKALNTKKAQEMSMSLGPQVFILLLTFLDIIYLPVSTTTT